MKVIMCDVSRLPIALLPTKPTPAKATQTQRDKFYKPHIIFPHLTIYPSLVETLILAKFSTAHFIQPKGW